MRKMTLGSKLLIGGISLVLIPVITVGIYSFIQSSKALEVSAGNEVEAVAEGIAGVVGQALADEVKLAKELAVRSLFVEAATRAVKGDGKDVSDSDTTDVNKELAAILKELGTENYETFVLVNSEGFTIGDARGTSHLGLDLREMDYIKTARSGKTGVGKPYPSKATGHPVVPVAAPILSPSGQFVGAIGVILKIDFFVDRICGTKVGRTGYAFMADGNGILIAHPKKDFMFKRNVREIQGMESISARMVKGEKGFEAYRIDGNDRIAGFAPVTISGWSVVASLDRDEFMAPIHTLRNGVILVGAVFLVLAVLGSVLLSRGISLPIARVVQGLNEAAEQVRAASGQVSSSSQQLAEGTSQQAAAVEETSSSLEEMSSMTRQNADNASQANHLMREASETVGQANRLMSDLTVSMGEISKASEETQKIIKTIDEIAFQTNLLALNAAVEAARAGEAGAGFAVVADEVRNLAMRAADAAKNTANLIEGTVKRVHNGADVVGKTNSEFTNVAASVGKSGELVGEIAAASHEQSQGIHQVNKAVAEMEQVIQQNAANAEESASAAEEMNAQAEQMKAFVDELALIIGGVRNERGISKKGKAMPVPAPMPQRLVKAGRNSIAGKPEGRGTKEISPDKLIPFDEDEAVF